MKNENHKRKILEQKQPELNLKAHVTHVCEVAFDLMKEQVYVIALKMYVCKGDQGIINNSYKNNEKH